MMNSSQLLILMSLAVLRAVPGHGIACGTDLGESAKSFGLMPFESYAGPLMADS